MDLYFSSTNGGSSDGDNSSNWFEDSGFTTPHNNLPTTGDTAYIAEGVCSSYVFSCDAVNVYAGATLTTLAVSFTVNDNAGIIITNNGTITNVSSGGSVTTNNNAITVNNISGTVTTNASGGTIDINAGTVTTNAFGGVVTDNTGTITTNSGIVTTNNEIVTTNNGTVTNNYDRVTTNASGGVVTNNYTTITTNAAGGSVLNNFGTVTTNNGDVRIGTITGGAGTLSAPAATNLASHTNGTNMTLPSAGSVIWW